MPKKTNQPAFYLFPWKPKQIDHPVFGAWNTVTLLPSGELDPSKKMCPGCDTKLHLMLRLQF